MADYSKLASTVLEKVGGKENVENVVHCLTRLRFTLKDLSLAKKDEIEEIPRRFRYNGSKQPVSGNYRRNCS